MTDEKQVDTLLHKKRDGKRIVLAEGTAPPAKQPSAGRLPRITRYMALAIYYEDLIRQGHVHDYAEIAMLGHVNASKSDSDYEPTTAGAGYSGAAACSFNY